ncbi:hypothetical protein QA596_03240 [Balneolales bacterium ANBcel1]|nr:hypothetical protein [Balneolales bacterium ANBcel1]
MSYLSQRLSCPKCHPSSIQNSKGSAFERHSGRMSRLLWLLLFLLLIPLTDTIAQSGGYSGAFTRMGMGPRGMAMGNAMGTVSEEGIFAHYNPALAAYAGQRQLDIGTALMSFDRSLNVVNFALPLPPSAGLNIGLLNANVSDIDGRTSSGYHTDYLSTHEFQLFASFGLNISTRLKAGVSVKLHLANFHESVDNATGAGFDAGIIFQATDSWRIGFAAQDLVSEYSWDTTDLYGAQGGRSRSDPFPDRFRLGSSYRLNQWNLLLSTEYEIQRQNSEYRTIMITEGQLPPRSTTRSEDNVTTHSHLIRFGASWQAHERFTLRGGWEVMDLDYIRETHRISTGFSVHLPYDFLSPSVDYAFVREPLGISGMHVLSIRMIL